MGGKILSLFLGALTVSIFFQSGAEAQNKRIEYGRDKKTGQVIFLKNNRAYTAAKKQAMRQGISVQRAMAVRTAAATRPADPVLTADRFLLSYASSFGTTLRDLYPLRAELDELGMTHVRYEQRYRGVPVYGTELIAHVGANNLVTTVNGRVAKGLRADLRQTLSKQAAIDRAVSYWQAQFGTSLIPETVRADRYILANSVLAAVGGSASSAGSSSSSGSSSSAASRLSSWYNGYLVFRVELASDSPASDEFYLVDARTGELRHAETGVRQLYRRACDCSVGMFSRDACYCGRYFQIPGGEDLRFGRNEDQGPAGPSPFAKYSGVTDVDDAFDLLGVSHNYFLNAFGRDGFNGYGGLANPFGALGAESYKTHAYVILDEHSTLGPGCPRASTAFTFNNGITRFCHNMITPDVVGHEFSHGLNFYSHVDAQGHPIGTIYQGESGSLDESQADYFGLMIKEQATGSHDWVFGQGAAEGPYHDLSNPPSIASLYPGIPGAHPDRYTSPDFYCGTSEDLGGVHFNSTVPGKALYLTAAGGTFNGCSVTGLGLTKVAQILYRAVVHYYSTTETFNGAYFGLVQACREYYPESDCQELIKALQAAEMDQPGKCSGTPAATPACAPNCFDSDGGDVPTVAGAVTVGGTVLRDYCVLNNTTVVENYCSGGVSLKRMQRCLSGCVDGACI